MDNTNLKNKKYWEERAERAINAGEKTALQMLDDLRVNYEQSQKRIEKEILAFYGRYATEQGLSYEEVQKRLNKSELKAFREQAKVYYEAIKETDHAFDPEYKKKLHRESSAKAYMSRLEELKANIQFEIENLFAKEQSMFKENLENVYENTYYQTIFDIQQGTGIGSTFTNLNKRVIEKAVAEKWLGDNYSSDIWRHKDILTKNLNTIIPQGFILGHNPLKIAKDILALNSHRTTDLKRAYNNAVRLARTEFIKKANDARLDAFKASGVVTQYKISAGLDERTCEICGKMDGVIVDVDKAEVAVNIPTFHPNCRCAIIPYFPPDEIDEMFEKAQRIAIDANGKRYYVDADMTFEEWKEKYGVTKDNKSDIITLDKADTIDKLTQFAKEKWGVEKIDIKGLDPKAIQGTFKAMDKVFEEYPRCKGFLKEIAQNNTGIMAAAPISKDFARAMITFNPEDYKDINRVKQKFETGVQSGKFPQNTTWVNAGVHELGHLLNAIIIKDIITPSLCLEDWQYNITATAIVKKALKKAKFTDSELLRGLSIKYSDLSNFTETELLAYFNKGLKPKDKRDIKLKSISNYASTDDGETIAEAFSDWFVNRDNANSLSKEIVREMNTLLNR